VTDGQAHHLQNVLRCREGDEICVFNGQGGEYPAVITGMQRHRIGLQLAAKQEISRESPLSILLAQGIARGERMDFAIQKAVELGVAQIQPLHTEKSQRLPAARLDRKLQHWRAVARSAAEQSGRTLLPEVRSPQALADWLTADARTFAPGERLLLSPTAENGFQAQVPSPRACLLIGPESGLGEKEIALALQAGFNAVRMGPRVLRTETAGVVAISALQVLWGDLG